MGTRGNGEMGSLKKGEKVEFSGEDSIIVDSITCVD